MTIFVFGEAMLEYHGYGGEELRYGGNDFADRAVERCARAARPIVAAFQQGTDDEADSP